MPTFVTHAVSGIAVSKIFGKEQYPKRITWFCIICSILPDIDSIGFHLGIPYYHWLGHRGFYHSITFAFVLALILSLFLSRGRYASDKLRIFTTLFISLLFHDVLDAMTDGGLGVAFFSPFSELRFFLPWRPIKVSPLSLSGFLNIRGLEVIFSELIWVIIPVFFVAVVTTRQRKINRIKHKL